MQFYLTAPVRVHCWGGLGSQLFAYNLLLDLSRRFPRRRLVLIFHSGGITKREPEIEFLLKNFCFHIKDDFVPESKGADATGHDVNKGSLFRLAKRSLQSILIYLGFIGLCNNDHEFNKLKPWVISIRGHYTHRKVSYSNLEILEFRAREAGLESPSKPVPNKVIGLQYRLGDLLYTSTKSPISVERIEKRIRKILEQNPDFKVEIHSDVNAEAENLLGISKNQKYIQSDAWSTICKLSGNQLFVGTNSKISEWVVIFRLSKDPDSIAFLPADFRLEVLKAISNSDSCVKLFDL